MNQDNKGNKRNKKDKKQNWQANSRSYQPKKQSSNHYNNNNHSNSNNNHHNNYHNQYNDYNENHSHYDNRYNNNYRNNNHRNNNHRFQSNSYNGRNHNHAHKSYNQNSKFNNSRPTICRAPIEECNNQLMKHVNEQNNNDFVGIQQFRYRTWPNLGWKESESLTIGKYFYSKIGSNYQTWKKPKELINNNNYEETWKQYPWRNQVDRLESKSSKQNISIKPFTVTTNTFPIELNEHINVLEYEINIQPKSENSNEKKCDDTTDLDKLFKKYDKRRVVKNSFDPYVIENNTNKLFTFAYDNIEQYESFIEFPEHFDHENIYSFILRSVHSLHFYAGMENECKNSNDDDEDEVSPERRTQIFQCILSSILLKTGFKFINFGPSKGWYPANQNKNLNNVSPVYDNPRSAQLGQIGVIRGFKASIDSSANGVALKVSNTNKIVHAQTLAHELEDLYHSDPGRYGQNVRRFMGRRALYLPTQKVITITEIKINENEQSIFMTNRNGKEIQKSHKTNLLEKGVVSNVLPEKYGLVSNRHDFSFLPQFMHLLFEQDLSKKHCKDALLYLGKNIDYELQSVNNFVKHVRNMQSKCKDNKNDMILSLISISNKAYETYAYTLPNVSIQIKTKDESLRLCDELSIASEWRNIGGLISEPTNGCAKTILVGASVSMVKKVKLHIMNYLQRRKFGNLIMNEISDFVPKDIWEINELKTLLLENKYELLIFILPNISDGSKLKRKIHRMCLELGVKSQCISDELFYDNIHTKQRNVVWGMMSDIVYKLGATTYNILSNITSPILNEQNTMVMGLDICHPTRIRSTLRPSIAVMSSLYGNIMAPNIKQQNSSFFLNNNRQEICGYKAIVEMCMDTLKRQLLRDDIDMLPEVILFCRDGISDSQIPQMVSKELTALLLSIRKVKKIKEIVGKYKNIKQWKPKIEWIVVQKRILDRFAVSKNTMKLYTHSPAFIVPSDVVSGEYFEFYLQIGKRKPKRIIFIKDDLNLRKDGIVQIAQFLYATHWLYPPCIPFQMGPLSVPVPIKLSDHYASMWQDMLTYNDNKITDIKTNKKLHNPQIVNVQNI